MAGDPLETKYKQRTRLILELDKASPAFPHGESLESEAATKEKRRRRKKKKKKKKKKSLESDAEAASKEEEEEEEKKKSLESEAAATKKVAYLRLTGDLTFPYRLIDPDLPGEFQIEGAAREFMRKLYEDLNKAVHPKRKEEIFCREIELYIPQFLSLHQDFCGHPGVLPETITSREDWYKVSGPLRAAFRRKSWFLNQDRDGGDYQLLCLRHHPTSEFAYDTNREPIQDLVCLNRVGNTLEADIQYKDFRDMVFAELQWDDTEVDGVNKAIHIRDKYFPCMKDLTIPWVFEEWADYNEVQEEYWNKIYRMCQLWYQVAEGRVRIEKGKFKKAVHDIYKRCDESFVGYLFDRVCMVKEYIDDNLRRGLDTKVGILIQGWFEVHMWSPEPKCDKGSYTLYAKEKIRKAIQLGIVRKEDVEKFRAGAQLLEEIEQENPGVFYDSEH